ncbi:alpha-L-fucosidase [Bacillaceae bacterium SIJ1]|uniref:alpha-L-fucosidase n=1 Tax=Litoribacterium kuwaitense TaxID=1398745 RepID=UPI0013EE2369|nr:alpha-L-fucosidase [Litoribacterium kuwaitense]NGP43800.1 alpha-L-fucosidase [Litoribacterium kuwaitense]
MSIQSFIKPTERQLEFQHWGFGLFLHFGLRTFYEGYVDFDDRPMSPSAFNPSELDCEQWIRTAKEAGMKYAVLTAKHHDGFSNWPSKYTTFSVAQSPWKEGKGDVVAEFVQACRKYDIKPGLYYSPYDGDAQFYNQDAKAYDDYFVHQITELLTNYGNIDILWFDGAGSEGHEYDWSRIVKQIRSLQPNILIFNMADPDIRWAGNEDGIAPVPCWNTVDSLDYSIYSDDQKKLEHELWLPAECNVQLRVNWFYSDSDEHTIKSLDQLMGIYYHSVGRGANLLLNIGPDRKGKLPDKDTERLREFGAEINARFDAPLATMEQCEYTDGQWIYRANGTQLIDHVVLQEDLTNGEAVKRFKVTIVTAKTGQHCVIYEGRNIGNKAIIQIPPINVRGVMVEVTESEGTPVLRDLRLYYVCQ